MPNPSPDHGRRPRAATRVAQQVGLACAAIATSTALASAQHAVGRARPVPSAVRDAGTYHLSTRTWTRAPGRESFGPHVIYQNNAQSGFFGSTGAPIDLVWTDEGRIPSTSGHSGAQGDEVWINGVDLAYCSSVAGQQQGALAFYECYASCTDPVGQPVSSGFAFSVPGGGPSGTTCWMVTFDLEGTSLEFLLNGDCDAVFDGSSGLDDFGWTLTLHDQGSGGNNGPILAGDPNNFPYGDGTYYQNPGASLGTGLDTVDQYWLSDSTGSVSNGCYWFGGYPNGGPFASSCLTLYGQSADCSLGEKYCVATANSTGAAADLTADGSSDPAAGTLMLTSAPVPNQPGIFFHGANQAQIVFGNGFLCATGGIVRGAVVVGAGNAASYVYDNSDAKHSLGAFAGLTRNFQHWYRDPMGGGAFFNTSNAIAIQLDGGSSCADIDIDSFAPGSATAGVVVGCQGDGFGFFEDNLWVQVVDSAGDATFSRATNAASSSMDFLVEAIPTGMTSGRIHVQAGRGVRGTIANLPPSVTLEGTAWSWVDEDNDGAKGQSNSDIVLFGSDPSATLCGGAFHYGKVENARLRMTILGGGPIPANSRIVVRVGVITVTGEYALACSFTIKNAIPFTTCDAAVAVCELLQLVFYQQHGLFLTCTTTAAGNCATNPNVTIVVAGPNLMDFHKGRGAVEICPP